MVTSDSPCCCICSLALYLETGLGSTIGHVMTHELKVCINHRAGEMIRHEVSRIIGSQNLPHLELVEILFLLDPQSANIDVPELADPFPIRNC